MKQKAQIAYRVATGAFVVGVFVQVFLIGLSIFNPYVNINFHKLMGGALHGLSTLMWILSAYTRQPLQTTRLNGVLFGVLTLQGLLPHLRGFAPALAALHPVNALVIFWIGLILARRAEVLAWLTGLRKPTITTRQPVYRQPAHSAKS